MIAAEGAGVTSDPFAICHHQRVVYPFKASVVAPGGEPATAARVERGGVLATARVQRPIAGLFVAEERGTHTLKGVPEPTSLFRLVRASGGGRRSGQRNLTPLVGRDEEIAMLMRRWERARPIGADRRRAWDLQVEAH
jgi:hypothetical protein